MHPDPELVFFALLKQEIASVFRKSHPSCTIPMEEWKGQDIVNFQEELMNSVKGRISEKWFYTHIKSGGDKLPRIDMLNMLSQYAGYESWRDLMMKNREKAGPTVITGNGSILTPIPGPKKKTWLWFLLLVCISVFACVWIFMQKKEKVYRCCLVDATGKSLVPNARVQVKVLDNNDSPSTIVPDSSGCFFLTTGVARLRFVISSPYYKTDTILRTLSLPERSETLRLATDDYSLMIHYFSTGNVKDWKKRRMQLDDMITEEAKIYQVYDDPSGIELYNKEEFINKMTMPLKSLKNIEIIETRYANERISFLKFRQTIAAK